MRNSDENQPRLLKSSASQLERTESSQWLVRLRRFASNEVDIIKMVVNNLGIWSQGESLAASNPVVRQISFKNLEPSSGYELCIESASPNQQVGDRYQIFDANHFLKCQDTSDVQMSTTQGSQTNSTTTMRRMDMSSLDLVDADSSDMANIKSAGVKLKSICKEFFTLPASSSEKVSFGAGNNSQAGNITSSERIRRLKVNQELANATAIGANLRRPKSLNNTLKSRIELLEINDVMAINSPKQPITFEMVASRSPLSRLVPSDSQNDNQIVQPFGERELAAISNRNDYLGTSALPIVGCIFALVFIVTLANMILNAISCRSQSARTRRAAKVNALMAASGAGRTEGSAGSLIGGLNGDKLGHLGSFYSDSDHSGTSQSRIVVGGKHGQPGAMSYFEYPVESSVERRRLASSQRANNSPASNAASSSNGSGGKHSSAYLLASTSARFPLGPSFEGDSKHNADMVGLARKNYDNIINNIYNRDELSSGPESLGAEQHSPVCGGRIDKRRHCQAHGHKPNRLRQLSSADLVQDTARGDCADILGSTISSNTQQIQSADRIKKQRIRFDKINPIYNMESLYAVSCGSRCRSPSNRVSSFGHSSGPVSGVVDKNDDHVASVEDFYDEDCPLCAKSPESNELAVEAAQSAPDGCTCDDSLENCDPTTSNPSAAYYTCCLDRQKQRFQKQQQQLEMVLTKNGSLIPQPFINPSGPDAGESLSEAQQMAIKSLGSDQEIYLPETQSVRSDRLDESDKKMIASSKEEEGDVEGQTDSSQRMTAYQFGDNITAQAANTLPAPNGASQPIGSGEQKSNEQVGSKTLVPIGSMGGQLTLASQLANEALKRTDFDQRRNELASKLHLAGMSKP